MTNFSGYIFLFLGIILGITSNGFLKSTNGFTNLGPTIFCAISIVACIFCLSKAFWFSTGSVTGSVSLRVFLTPVIANACCKTSILFELFLNAVFASTLSDSRISCNSNKANFNANK